MKRKMLKGSSYGAMHFVVAVSVAYVISRDWVVALSIGTIEPAIQTIAYLIHEECWSKFRKEG